MSQPDTGITSFDVPNLLGPMQDCLAKMQKTLQQDREKLVNQMNRDPVPQFTQEQIESATGFLQAALDAMQNFMDDFKKDAFKNISDSKLVQMQEMARESARQLVLLLGDRTSGFSGGSMKGTTLDIQEAQQGRTIQARLTSLQQFLQTFGSARWLDQSIADGQFEGNKKLAIEILSGLIAPTKIQQISNAAHGGRDPGYCSQSCGTDSVVNGRCSNCGREYEYCENCHTFSVYSDPWSPDWSDNWSNCYGQDRHCGKCGHYQSNAKAKAPSATNPPPSATNPLGQLDQEGVPGKGSSAAYLKCLDRQCKALAEILEQDEQNIADMQHRLGMKMTTLKAFATVLNRIPAVLNSYVLVRLSDVSTTDSTMLKQWISQEQATKIHKMLETFRDDVIQERAMREIQERLMAASSGRCSELSSSTIKEYLLYQSMGAESVGDSALEEWSDVNGADAQERAGDTGDGQNGKPSHRQRARKAKFRASIPRTPSSS